MKKKNFQNLIQERIDKYKCLIISDATIRHGKPHSAIKIIWNNNLDGSFVKVMRCKQNDPKIINELSKYKDWANQILN